MIRKADPLMKAKQLDLFPDCETERNPYRIIATHKIAIQVTGDWQGCLHQTLLGKRNKQAFWEFPQMELHKDQLQRQGYLIITPAPSYDHEVPDYRLTLDHGAMKFIKELDI